MLQPALATAALVASLPAIATPPLLLEDAATIALDALAERFPSTDPRALTFPSRKRALFTWDDGPDIRTCWVSVEDLPPDSGVSRVSTALFDRVLAAMAAKA